MGDGKRLRRQKLQPQKHRQPLEDDYSETASFASSKKRARAHNNPKREDAISSNLSSKILQEALSQQREIAQEEAAAASAVQPPPFSSLSSAVETKVEDEDIDGFDGFSEAPSQYDAGEQEIDEEDERLLQAFMPKNAEPQLTLADIIVQKIKERNADVASVVRPLPKLDSSIIDIYKGVGKLLSRYSSGKLPKAFKHIPSLELWEDVLYLTEPEQWSPNAMYQATRIFSSNFGVKKAQRFYNLVLLPRVRDDIRKNKRLHFALYQSLKKSLYKPAAFFKGILLPLCESGTCSLREAVIVGSTIQKASIPPLHSSIALMKLAELVYCGTTSYFVKLFLDKKYALPYRVLDAVLAHFMRFLEETRLMHVIWHQSLLSFVLRYKNELTKEDKHNLVKLIEHQKHHLVTPEIYRELKDSRNRGEKEDDVVSISSSVSVINKKIEEDRWDCPDVPMEED